MKMMDPKSLFYDEDIIDKIYLIADTHFFHKNIGKYCNRPEGWQDTIVYNWNKTISDNDHIIHLGDLSFNNKENTDKLVSELKGIKYLIKGNHDRKSESWHNDIGFNIIQQFTINYKSLRILFSHRPIPFGKFKINIHGHIHNNGIINDNSYYLVHYNGNLYVNVCVEVHDYKPIKFLDLIENINKFLEKNRLKLRR